MKLTTGWWKARDGSRWHVDWVGERLASGHNQHESTFCWFSDGSCERECHSGNDLISPWTEPKEGSSEWAKSLPVGTKLRRADWRCGSYVKKREDGWTCSEGVFCEPGDGVYNNSGWLLYTEPNLRPWKTVEVPVGMVIRHKDDLGVKYLILNAAEGELLVACIDGGAEGCWLRRLKLDVVSELYEHAFVGSDNWLPCGVLEEEK